MATSVARENGVSSLSGPQVDLEPEGRQGCCSSVSRRMKKIWNWVCCNNSAETKALIGENGAPLLGVQRSSSLISRTTSAVADFFGHRLIIGGLATASLVGMAIAAPALNAVFSEYTRTCIDDLNTFSGELSVCRAPFQSRISGYESTLAVSGFILGFILQKLWGLPHRVSEQSVQDAEEDDEGEVEVVEPAHQNCADKVRGCTDKVKILVDHIQNSFSYELNLGLGWLYNGLWIDTNDIPSWKAFFNCQAAAIGLAAAFLGMYMRIEWVAFKTSGRKQFLPALEGVWNHRKELAVSGVGAACIVLSTIPEIQFSSKMRLIAREIGLMLAAVPFGLAFANWVDRQNFPKGTCKAKLLRVTRATLSLQSPMVAAGYSMYIVSTVTGVKLTGIALVGIAQGIHRSRYRTVKEPEKPINEVVEHYANCCAKALRKTCLFVQSYWKTGVIIGFAITSSQVKFLDCYNVKNFVCPLSFEFSGHYMNIDAEGVNLAITVGLTTFYTRKLFKALEKRTSGRTQAFSRNFIHVMDQYQFDLLTLFPYALVNSGEYIKDYDAYSGYNSKPPLILIGITLANYKEQVDSGVARDSYRPIFTNVAAVAAVSVGDT